MPSNRRPGTSDTRQRSSPGGYTIDAAQRDAGGGTGQQASPSTDGQMSSVQQVLRPTSQPDMEEEATTMQEQQDEQLGEEHAQPQAS